MSLPKNIALATLLVLWVLNVCGQQQSVRNKDIRVLIALKKVGIPSHYTGIAEIMELGLISVHLNKKKAVVEEIFFFINLLIFKKKQSKNKRVLLSC